ncbi:MAG: lipid-A-disaccharide synthase [Candidatus Omnitrophota bacterium]
MNADNLLIIAGEPSGDAHGASLLKELKILLPNSRFWGIGGNCMEQEGFLLVEHIRNLSIIGVWEALKNLPKIYAQYKKIASAVDENKPKAAILIDYPGFNLKIAKLLTRKKIPVFYYIIPQVWVWGKNRIHLLRKFTDKCLVLFKFEEELLLSVGIDCEFVGHPLMDKIDSRPAGNDREGENNGANTIALLPGSRKSEIQKLLPVMLDSAEKIRMSQKDISFISAENSNIDPALYDSFLSSYSHLSIKRVKDNTLEALRQCDFAIVASGTATLETAAMEKPMLIIYRSSAFTTLAFRLFIRLPFVGLVNIIAGKEVCPELLQEHAVPEEIAAKTLEILTDQTQMENTKKKLREIRDSLGGAGASKRAAVVIQEFLRKDFGR